MAIVSLNMGNLIMEVKTMKNNLITREQEKAMLQKELDKERNFQNGYKHNVEISRKNMAKAEQKNKVFIKKLQDDNDEFKGSTTPLKFQDEKLYNSRQKVEIWETTWRKWTYALFLHKKQQEALDSQVKTLIK